jgi:hypothetical protein
MSSTKPTAVSADDGADASPDELVPEGLFCQKCDITKRTAREWRARGDGPEYMRLGRQIFYRRSRIQRWHDVRSFCRRTDEIAA